MNDGHGQRVENAVEAVSYKLFGSDFVLRSPQLVEPSGPKELTDILVVIDDTAIIIQSKSLAIDIADLDLTKIGRIQKRQAEAKRQINTTLNAHTRGATIRASNALNMSFDLNLGWIKKKIGIVTLHVTDDLYTDPEFRFQYPDLVEEHRGIIVHTFLLNDLAQMTSDLSTPADVLRYLDSRQKCLLAGKVMIGNELDFLAIFKSRYPEIEKALAEPECVLCLAPGLWETYRKDKTGQIRDRDKRLRSSGAIDRLIRALRTSVEYSAKHYGIGLQDSAVNYLKLIGKFGKLGRIERANIGDKLLGKLEKTKSSKWGYFIYVSKHANTAYLFLLVNEKDREKRMSMLQFLCVQACHTVDCAELVGIASEGSQQRGSSIDGVVMDVAEVRSRTTPESGLRMFDNPSHETIQEW